MNDVTTGTSIFHETLLSHLISNEMVIVIAWETIRGSQGRGMVLTKRMMQQTQQNTT